MTSTDAPLRCQRAFFSLDPRVHYLNCAFMGPLPRVAVEAGEAGLRRKENPWRFTSPDFFGESDQVREAFARIVGGEAHRVAIHPSVSYAVATAARNIPLEAGDEIVLLGEQFPGNVYAWHRLAAEAGARVVTVERPKPGDEGVEGAAVGAAWNARLLEAIGSRTRVVSIPPLHWTDGTRFDLPKVGARAREVGAWFLIDGTQAVGGTPLDVSRIGCDLLVTGAYKWLLGPYSLALTWMGERFDAGVPLEEGWITREGSEDFRGLVDYVEGYQPGAIRYDVGERSNFALLPVALASMNAILDWDVPRIERYVEQLAAPIFAEAPALGFGVEEEGFRARHLFGLKMPPQIDLQDLKTELDAAEVHASLRGSSLRVSPNVYNDVEDVAALLEVLRAAVSR